MQDALDIWESWVLQAGQVTKWWLTERNNIRGQETRVRPAEKVVYMCLHISVEKFVVW